MVVAICRVISRVGAIFTSDHPEEPGVILSNKRPNSSAQLRMLNKLPPELLPFIAVQLETLDDHVAFSRTCATFHAIYTETFWMDMLERHGLSRSPSHLSLLYGRAARALGG